MGPVQVLVLGFDEPRFTGEILAELERLGRSGVVRLVDALLVTKDEAGQVSTVSFEELGAEVAAGSGELAAAFLGEGGTGDDAGDDAAGLDTWSLADTLPVGGVAAVALIEHLWATPLREAISRAGGRTLEETWLHPRDLADLGNLLEPS